MPPSTDCSAARSCGGCRSKEVGGLDRTVAPGHRSSTTAIAGPPPRLLWTYVLFIVGHRQRPWDTNCCLPNVTADVLQGSQRCPPVSQLQDGRAGRDVVPNPCVNKSGTACGWIAEPRGNRFTVVVDNLGKTLAS